MNARPPKHEPHRFSRRTALSLATATTVSLLHNPIVHAQAIPQVVVSVDPTASEPIAFDRRDHSIVGVYDVDWLLAPGYERLLDNLAASPDAFHGVRFFGAFTAGQRERISPEGGGRVWPSSDQPPDFTTTFAALAALTSRGLIPFVVLSFFPPAVSPSPIQPPTDWTNWKTLVRSFFDGLIASPRFGPGVIRDWWFEVWNEPNEGRFWLGHLDDYLDLYRATSEAVAETRLKIRLGGPAIAYKPEEDPNAGPPWLDRFLRFITADSNLQCDFISIHRKGTVTNDPPDPRRLVDAAVATADQALAIDPVRFRGLPIINNEADEKVGFEIPYQPRVDERNASWLSAVTASHAALNAQYRSSGLHFITAADNANLHLVEAPFDGRRSIMTRATMSGSDTDLLKIPAYGSYELLRLLGDQQGILVTGTDHLFPDTDLYHLATYDDERIAVLLTHYPDPDCESDEARTIDYLIRDIPWPRVNVARFQIDRTTSNAYTAADGSDTNPFPIPEMTHLPAIRQAQEVALHGPIIRDHALPDRAYREQITLAPYATTCLWITPTRSTQPATPTWIEAIVSDGNVVLRWTPYREPWVYSYDVFLIRDQRIAERLSPDPLRAAMWVDTAPSPGERTYAVRSQSASGVASPFAISGTVFIT